MPLQYWVVRSGTGGESCPRVRGTLMSCQKQRALNALTTRIVACPARSEKKDNGNTNLPQCCGVSLTRSRSSSKRTPPECKGSSRAARPPGAARCPTLPPGGHFDKQGLASSWHSRAKALMTPNSFAYVLTFNHSAEGCTQWSDRDSTLPPAETEFPIPHRVDI